MATTTQGMIYITALSTLEKLEVQYIPRELTSNRQVNLGEVQVVGRNNPLQHYTGGSNRIRLELEFYSDQRDREDVIAKCRLLESWAMNDGNVAPQEKLRVTFGRMFKENEIYRISDLSVDYSMFSPTKGMLPRQATANIELVLDPKFNRKAEDVKWI